MASVSWSRYAGVERDRQNPPRKASGRRQGFRFWLRHGAPLVKFLVPFDGRDEALNVSALLYLRELGQLEVVGFVWFS